MSSTAATAAAAAASYAAQLGVVQPLPSLRVAQGPYLFRADFDSANLARVEYAGHASHPLDRCFDAAHLHSPDAFDLWLHADPMSSYRVFFHFAVRGGRKGKQLRLCVRNLNNKKPLIGEGMRPLVRSVPSAPEWRRVEGVEFTTLQTSEGAGRSFLAPEDGGGEDGEDGGGADMDEPSAGAGDDEDDVQGSSLPAAMAGASLSARSTPGASPAASPSHSRQSSQSSSALAGAASAARPRKPSAGSAAPAASASAAAPKAASKKIKHDVLELTIVHTFEADDEETFFAFCLPYSYTQLQSQLLAYERRFAPSAAASAAAGVYFHRELLTHSLEGRRVDLITISSHRGRLGTVTEPDVPGLFPPPTADSTKGADPTRMWAPTNLPQPSAPGRARELRACSFAPSAGKVLILLSARVHPGETPSSLLMAGALDFLLDTKDPRARALRDRAVIKIVPMLNPDGVAHGYYRCDSLGQNLNRFYDAPVRELHPSIWAVRALVEHWMQGTGPRLHTYIDMHSHAMKRGLFIFGNHIEDLGAHLRNVSFARLLQINCPYLSLPACNFSAKNMRARDQRDGLSKEGAGRVAFYKLTQCTHAYTCEVNYHCGRTVNSVAPLPGKPWTDAQPSDSSAAAVPAAAASASASSASLDLSWQRDDHLLSQVVHPPVQYLEPQFRSMGKALCVSVLDLLGGNEWSRLPLTEERDQKGLETWARKWSMKPPKRLLKRLGGKPKQAAAAAAGAKPSS